MLRIQLFGEMRIMVDGETQPTPTSQKARLVLARLAEPGGNLAREVLAEALWDTSLSSARASLNTEVKNVRRSLGRYAPLLTSRRDYIGLPGSDELSIDVREFTEHLSLENYEQAIALYAGAFLQDTGGDTWADERRSYYRRTAARILGLLAERAETADDLPSALDFTRRQRDLLPDDPEPAKRLIRILVATGDLITADAEREVLIGRFATRGIRIPAALAQFLSSAVPQVDDATHETRAVPVEVERIGVPLESGRDAPPGRAQPDAPPGEDAPRDRPELRTPQADLDDAERPPLYTGLVELDEMLGGLAEPGLTIIAGRPGMGTTTLALTIAANASIELGIPTALFSTESSERQLTQRLVGMRARISSTELRRGRVAEAAWPRVLSASQILAAAPLFLDDSAQLEAGSIVEQVRHINDDGAIRLVILDSIHGLTDNGRRALDAPSIAGVLVALRQTARVLNASMIVTMEVLGDCDKRPDKKPGLSDLPGYFEVGARRDAVLLLYRDDYYDADSERPGELDIIIAENHHGPVGRVVVGFDARTSRIMNLARVDARDISSRPARAENPRPLEVSTPETSPPTPQGHQMLEAIYDAFSRTGVWPRFQYVTASMWEGLQGEPREIYHQLSAGEFVRPAISTRQDFQLREDTQVAISLRGLTYVRRAVEDIGNFVSAVRYIAERAVSFRPSTPFEVESLTITSEEIRLHLAIEDANPALVRVGALLRDEAWGLGSGFSWQDGGPWSMSVVPEAARRYRETHTVIDFMTLRDRGARVL